MGLKIDELTSQVELEKTAEEQEMEKLAETVNVLEQAQTLTVIGEDLYKFAEMLEDGDDKTAFSALGEDLFNIGSRMGAALVKTAAEGEYGLIDSIEIAEDLNKIAFVIAEIADEAQDEEFNKLAEAVVEISNQLTEEAEEVSKAVEAMEKEAGVKETAGKVMSSKVKSYLKSIQNIGDKAPKTVLDKVKFLATHKKGLKAVGEDAAKAGVASGLGFAEYKAIKHDKR